MPNRKAKITRAELSRYLQAYRDAGIEIARTEINSDGKVIIFTNSELQKNTQSDWDS